MFENDDNSDVMELDEDEVLAMTTREDEEDEAYSMRWGGTRKGRYVENPNEWDD